MSANAQSASAEDAATKAYLEHCRACHGTEAAVLAASSLRRLGDKVVTKKHATDLTTFLTRHGAADAAERADIEALLMQALGAN